MNKFKDLELRSLIKEKITDKYNKRDLFNSIYEVKGIITKQEVYDSIIEQKVFEELHDTIEKIENIILFKEHPSVEYFI